MSINGILERAIAQACESLGISVGSDQIHLEHPEDLAHGDFATNIALALAKPQKKNPRALGEEIAAALVLPEAVERVDVAGPGFINFHLKPTFFAQSLAEIIAQGKNWGHNEKQKGHEVVVEYTDPNPFKAFHIGHLMSNAIGESIARLVESQGVKVHRANYQGDVGIHIACAIWGLKKLGIDPHDGVQLGRAYSEGAGAYKADETAKAEINELNKKLYDKSDPELNEIYKVGREASLQLFEKIYAILGTTFDRYFFESELAEKGKAIVLSHPEVFEDSDGAKVFKGEKVGLHTRVFLSTKGLPIYETKELALAYEKVKTFPGAEKLYVVTANEITEYYKVVIAAMREIDPSIAEKMHHVPHGMMRLPEGKMSSRTGNVITGESLLQDLTDAALARAKESRADNPEQLAQSVAVAAIKFQVLRQGTGKDIIFEQEKALSLEGDTGPYVQYAYARCASLLEKGAEQNLYPEVENMEPSDLERVLYRFPSIVARAAEELQPHHVAHFAVHIAGLFNAWYATTLVLQGEHIPHKLAIVKAVKITLDNSLNLLGIQAPEKM